MFGCVVPCYSVGFTCCLALRQALYYDGQSKRFGLPDCAVPSCCAFFFCVLLHLRMPQILYYDGQFDDARLNVALATTAAAAGAAVANYVEATGLIKVRCDVHMQRT